MEVQEPRADSRRSYGFGPASVPPAARGSSAESRWRPTVISWARPLASPVTITVPTVRLLSQAFIAAPLCFLSHAGIDGVLRGGVPQARLAFRHAREGLTRGEASIQEGPMANP